MGQRPTGTVTFVFTDIEGSTRRWQADGDAMRDALAKHDSMLADCFEGAGGRIFKHTGDGVCAVFPTAAAALGAAVDAQLRLAAAPWDDVGGLPVRMGVHTGEASERDGDYFGPALNRAARIMDAAHGGQVLVSGATAALLADEAHHDVSLLDLGSHRLRDLDQPERLHQVLATGLPGDFPPPRTRSVATHNLPATRSSFVGRAGEIDEALALLRTSRVVTLVGIGGTGKSRLAVEVATRALDDFGGVWFVELAPLADGRQIPAAIASALGLGVVGPGSGSLVEAMVASLARRRSLLVLDNCEHLIDDCAALVDELLDGCPELTILATSREALSVDGERTWPVPSLPVEEAVELFVDRAAAVDPQFRLDAENEEAVADICRRLDGIPLAIELAASRLGHLSPAEIAARLDDRFRLLTGGRRRGAQRQQTLQAAIDWSHDLLDEGERRLFRRLSVFAGGFTLDAVEDVCAADPDERREVVDLLGSLVTKSLVVAERAGVGTSTRYHMLETMRLYAADRLVDAGEVEVHRDRHRDRWLAWLERTSLDELVTRRDLGELVEVELDNLRAAFDWSESQGRVDLAARIGVAMSAVWCMLGHHDEGAARLTALTESADLDEGLRARVLAVLSQIHMTAGDFPAMEKTSAESIALDPEGPLAALAHVYSALGGIFDVARYDEAHESFATARRIAERNGQPRLGVEARAVEGHFFLVEGDLDRPVAIARSIDPLPTFADMNARLAAVAALIERGEPEAALVQCDVLTSTWGQTWDAGWRSLVLVELGEVDEARASARVAISSYLERPYPLILADCLVALAALALQGGDAARAAEILESTIAERGMAGFRSPAIFTMWRRLRRRAKASLDAAELEAARARGRSVPALEMLHRERARL